MKHGTRLLELSFDELELTLASFFVAMLLVEARAELRCACVQHGEALVLQPHIFRGVRHAPSPLRNRPAASCEPVKDCARRSHLARTARRARLRGAAALRRILGVK